TIFQCHTMDIINAIFWLSRHVFYSHPSYRRFALETSKAYRNNAAYVSRMSLQTEMLAHFNACNICELNRKECCCAFEWVIAHQFEDSGRFERHECMLPKV